MKRSAQPSHTAKTSSAAWHFLKTRSPARVLSRAAELHLGLPPGAAGRAGKLVLDAIGALQKAAALFFGVVTLDQETCEAHWRLGDARFSIVQTLFATVHDGSHHLFVGSQIIK